LIAVGVVLVIGVVIYNAIQERRARRQAEQDFGERPPDALFEKPPAERREPTLGALPGGPDAPMRGPAPDQTLPPMRAEELDAASAPAAEVSSRIDTVAVILADHPIMSEQLPPLLQAPSSR